MPAAICVDRQAGGYTDRARPYKVLDAFLKRSNYIRLERTEPSVPSVE
ncbi:MAG: hypothetical protein K0R88_1908 [Solirubrobacterales bacterium]|jgi:hypothetical protein|nr:hypothetical protein [Solirubrobacterales bacterium]